MLAGYQGFLQVDAYTVYGKLFGSDMAILLIYCIARACRKFVDANPYDKQRANHVLERIQQHYLLEQEIRQ